MIKDTSLKLSGDYCGCCGRQISETDQGMEWCKDCETHLGLRHLPSWERTYSATHPGEMCPFESEIINKK